MIRLGTIICPGRRSSNQASPWLVSRRYGTHERNMLSLNHVDYRCASFSIVWWIAGSRNAMETLNKTLLLVTSTQVGPGGRQSKTDRKVTYDPVYSSSSLSPWWLKDPSLQKTTSGSMWPSGNSYRGFVRATSKVSNQSKRSI